MMSGSSPMFGAIEAGGTKFRVGVGSHQDYEATTIPTTTPTETLTSVVDYLVGRELAGVGVASFGPLDLDRKSSTFGYITTTPKVAWQETDLKGKLERDLETPVTLELDVGAAAIAEGAAGAASGCESFVYLTVGTGIGGAQVIGGSVHHGAGHPEMGHMAVKPVAGDDFAGLCPYHGNCLEGMASGPALSAREADNERDIDDIAARYLAQAIRSITYALAPQRIVLGGGVTQRDRLLSLVRTHVDDQLGGYSTAPAVTANLSEYIVAPAFGQDAGLVGAFILAERAAAD